MKEIALLLLAVSGFSLPAITAITSLIEQEYTAAFRSFLGALFIPLPFAALLFVSFPGSDLISWTLVAVSLLTVLVLSFPWPAHRTHRPENPDTQIDERVTMFSRNELKPGSPQYDSYYSLHPDHLANDEAFRKKPGLLNKGALFSHPLFFKATESSFSTIESLHDKVEPETSPFRQDLDPVELARFIKSWMIHCGAHSVGVTPLKPHHLYSTGGRRERYGVPIRSGHTCAIAFTMEMDRKMVTTGPRAPTILESADQYLNVAVLAVKLTTFLAGLGYPSRAHIDSNYLVVCPLVARDAGLGEIGRMGLLMTPRLGPRVRLAVVTTEIELPSDPARPEYSMTEFCRFCEKCAEICPSQAIPRGEMRPDAHGRIRWQIDQEKCFSYWCQTGTDCGRCVAHCPYSHPDNLVHNSVRALIRHSYFFRRFAARFDDWLYGKKPVPRSATPWKEIKQGEHR